MVDGGTLATVFGYAQTWMFWGIIILVCVFAAFGGLWLRKRRKLNKPAWELIQTAGRKPSFVQTKCGWFKRKKILWGLLDFAGEEERCLKDGRKIQNASSEDDFEFDGVRGPLVMRKADDPEVVVQIRGIDIDKKGLMALAEIAPGDLRDAAEDILTRAERETMKKWEKVMPYVVIGGVILFGILIIIFTIQFANNTLDKADQILKTATATNAGIPDAIGKAVGDAISQVLNKAPASTAP